MCVFEQLASVRKTIKLRNKSAAAEPIASSLLPSRKASALRPNISPMLKAPGLYSQGAARDGAARNLCITGGGFGATTQSDATKLRQKRCRTPMYLTINNKNNNASKTTTRRCISFQALSVS